VPIPLSCLCGKTLRVKEELVGRKVRCPGCREILTVVSPEPELVAQAAPAGAPGAVQAGKPRAWDQPRPAAVPPPLPPARAYDDEDDDRPRRKKAAYRDDENDADDRDRPRRKKAKPRRERSSAWAGPSIVISPAILSGLFAMLVAVVWFVAGLACDRIFIYPPIMFVLGIASVFRGLRGEE
jgi:hypothetical protein